MNAAAAPQRIVLLTACLALAGPVGPAESAGWPSDADAANAPAAEVTTIEIGSKVLVKDTVRFGINLGGDAYYSGAALVKDRARENFEGTSFRRCHFGPGSGTDGASTWFTGKYGDWDKILTGAKYTVLSGPSKWTTGTIKPRSVSTAIPMWQYFLSTISSCAASTDEANCGNALSADATILTRIAVSVSLPPAASAFGPNFLRACSSSVTSARSNCVTRGDCDHATARCSAVRRRMLLIG